MAKPIVSAADFTRVSFVVPQYRTASKEIMNAALDVDGRRYAVETHRVGMTLETVVWLNGRRMPENQRSDIRAAAEALFAESRHMVATGRERNGLTVYKWTAEERARRYAEFNAIDPDAESAAVECTQDDVAAEDDTRLYNCMPGGLAPDWSQFDGLEIGACMDVSEDDDESCIEGGQYIEDAEFFTVYGHIPGCGVESITDTRPGATYAEALELAAELAALSGLPITSYPPHRTAQGGSDMINTEKAANMSYGAAAAVQPDIYAPVALALEVDRLKAELAAMGMEREAALTAAHYYARLARARSPLARKAHDDMHHIWECKKREGHYIPPRVRFKLWHGACRAVIRDQPAFARGYPFNNSSLDVTLRADGLSRNAWLGNKYSRVSGSGVDAYFAAFDSVCKATGKVYKALELPNIRHMRIATDLTARLPR